jgi:cyclophilin family peptidyl-prolyl cis-trans isomerase
MLASVFEPPPPPPPPPDPPLDPLVPPSPAPGTLVVAPPQAAARQSTKELTNVTRTSRSMARECKASLVPHERAIFAAFRACHVVSIAVMATFVSCREKPLGPPSAEEIGVARGNVAITIDTTEGAIHCELDGARTPKSVAMFVGLATGRAPWRDPKTREIVRRPFYSDLAVFRAIPDALVQTGCPIGDGTGTPGYRIPVETSADDRERLARPGVLLLARYNPAPNRPDPNPPPPGDVIGSQIVIALSNMSHLADQVTVIGSCADHDVVRRISNLVAKKERPVRLVSVRQGRD